MIGDKKIKRLVFIFKIIVFVAILGVFLYIMLNHLGLVKDLDFGAGAYYYTDIPDFEQYMETKCYTELPFVCYIVLFFAWGTGMYCLWKWLDSKWKE